MHRSSKLKLNQKRELQVVINGKESTLPEVKRCQAILMVNDEMPSELIFQLTGYSEKHVYKLRKDFLDKGISSVQDQRRPKGKEILTQKQREQLLKVIREKTPNECDRYYNSDYWSTGILGEYIKRHYKVEYKSKTSYYLIFREAKFTYHKPGRVYEKRDEEAVKRWQKQMQPILAKAFADPDTIILAEDEMILSTQTTFQKIWLPQGEYPKIEVSNTRKNRSVYGFLNLKTGTEHAFKTEKQNMFITVAILKEIRSLYPDRLILLLWDGAGWHRGSEVRKFIEADGGIETHYFPSYSPEENPQEHVWKQGRSQVTHNHFIKNIDTATDNFVAYLNKTQFHYKILGIKT